jgi:hypothetical protein
MTRRHGLFGQGGGVDAVSLSRYLESFLLARCGCFVMDRLRVQAAAIPWDHEPLPEKYKNMMWVVFGDDREPLAVGIRKVDVRRGQPLFLCAYVRQSRQIESSYWQRDNLTGWQHVFER